MPEQEVKPGTQEDITKVSKRTNGTNTMPIPVSHGEVINIEKTTIGELIQKEVISYPRKFNTEEQKQVEDKEAYEVTVKIGTTDCSSETKGFVCSLGAYEKIYNTFTTDDLLEYLGKPDTNPLNLVGEKVPVRYFRDNGYAIQTTELDGWRRWKLDNGHMKWNSEDGYINRWYVKPVKAITTVSTLLLVVMYSLIFSSIVSLFELSYETRVAILGALLLGLLILVPLTRKFHETTVKKLCTHFSD